MTITEIEFLKRYKWKGNVNDISPRYDENGALIGIWIKPRNSRMRFFSRIGDDTVFFKTESDMIAYDNYDVPTLKYDHVRQRGEYLASVIG